MVLVLMVLAPVVLVLVVLALVLLAEELALVLLAVVLALVLLVVLVLALVLLEKLVQVMVGCWYCLRSNAFLDGVCHHHHYSNLLGMPRKVLCLSRCDPPNQVLLCLS